MYIESIELDNFKSFGERVVVPLFTGFTTISGPNGSGKSNIIDSLLFALGLSTNKTMRAERVTDLMNNLSGKSETKVTVTFYDEADESQLKIARKIRVKPNKQYESTYYLNEKPTTLAHIHDELALRHVSPNAYNVVMQGDVTSIISMSPTERRKIIDELAGVAQFDRKIESAQVEIGTALEKLQSQTILLSEFSERLENLKEERDQAIKYTELKGKRNKLEVLLRHIRISELKEQIIKLEKQLEGAKTEKEKTITNLKQVTIDLVNLQTRIEEITGKIEDLDSAKRQAAQEKLDTAKEQLSRIEASLEYLKKQKDDYQKQIEVNTSEQDINNQKIESIQKDIDVNTKKKEKLAAQLKDKESDYAKVQGQIKERSGNLSNNKLITLQEEQSKLSSAQTEVTTQKALAEERYSKIEGELAKARANLEGLLNQLSKVESAGGIGKAKELEDKINTYNKYLSRLKEERKNTEAEIQEITTKLYQYDKELSKLELREQVAGEQGYGRAVDAVLKSGMNGVHGVLAQLGEVKGQYTTALETAAGGRLRSLVVDHDGIAQRLIEFLREKKIGRATFLPLNKFDRIPDLPDLPSGKGIIGWAIDLVSCDDLYYPVFAYALGSTVVMKDLNAARRYLGTFRMVTLEGDLLEKSGAMTGGSRQKNAIVSFGNKEAGQLSELQAQIQHYENLLKNSRDSLKELNSEISEHEKELDKLRQEWSQSKASEGIEQANYQRLKDEIESAQSELKGLAEEKEKLETNVEKLTKEYNSSQQGINKIANQLIVESSKMKEAGIEDLINQSQEIEYEKKQLEVDLHNLEYERANLLSDSEYQLQNVQRKKLEVKQAQDEIKTLNKEIEGQNDACRNAEEALRKEQKEFDKVHAEVIKLNQEKEECNKSVLEKTEEKTKLAEGLKSLSDKIYEYDYKLDDCQNRLKELTQIEEEHENENLEHDIVAEIFGENAGEPTEKQLKDELGKIERQMQRMEPINMKAIEEYQTVLERLNEVKEKCENLESERKEIQKRIDSYSDHKHKSFFEAFDSVNDHFREIFEELSFGRGELILENPKNPFEGGLVIQARPRNKKMQRLESMSGGEKSLTALSFLFALQWHNPAPFYAFDEVDMFLDGLNVERLSKMVKKQSELAQFIVVSLRKPMLEKSDRAIGVCLGKDSFSHVSGIKLRDEKGELIESAA